MIDFMTKLPPTPPEDCDDAYFADKEADMFTAAQKKALAADLNSSAVKHRSQAGRDVSYIPGWWAISEANRVFGFDGWSCETLEVKLVIEGERANDRGKLYTCTYSARVRVTVYAGRRSLIREDVGAGHGMDRDPGAAHEKAAKEATTDAFKRAVRTFGNQFGLALYDPEQRNVSDTPAEEKPSVSRVSPPGSVTIANTVNRAPALSETIQDTMTWKERERSETSKRVADALIKGPLPTGCLPLESLRTALDTAGGSRTRTELTKWCVHAKKQRRHMTEADYARVINVYMPLDKAIKQSFEPVKEAAE